MMMRPCIGLVLLAVMTAACATAALADEGDDSGKPAVKPGQVAAVPQQETEGPAPSLELSPTEFKLGEIWQDAPAKQEFTVKNGGDVPLKVKVITTCGCTVATRPKSPLAPGESSTFSVTYDTHLLGKTSKSVTLETNDPAQPKLLIPISGEVKPIFAGQPRGSIGFTRLGEFSEESKTIKLENRYGKPLKLEIKEDAEQPLGRFTATLKEVEKGMLYELTVATKPPLAKGYNRGTVVLATSVEDLPPVKINVSANAQPRVLVAPFRIWVTPRQAQAFQRDVRVQFQKKLPIKITKVEVTHESIKFEQPAPEPIVTTGSTAYYRLKLTIPGFEEFPESGAKLVIYTDDESEAYQRLEVPIEKREVPTQSSWDKRKAEAVPAPKPTVVDRDTWEREHRGTPPPPVTDKKVEEKSKKGE